MKRRVLGIYLTARTMLILLQATRIGKEARYMWDGTSVTGREGRMNFLISVLPAAQ